MAPQLNEKVRLCSEILNAPDKGGGLALEGGNNNYAVGGSKKGRPGGGRGAEGEINQRQRGIQQLI